MFRDQEEAFKSVREATKRATALTSDAFDVASRLRPHGLREWHLPDDRTTSMASILVEAASVARFVRSLTQARAANMPASRLSELAGALSDLVSAVETFLDNAEAVRKEVRPLKYLKDGKVVGSITDEQYYDFGSVFSDISRRIEAVRNSTALIGIVSFDAKADERYEASASEFARRAGVVADNAGDLLEKAKKQADEIAEIVEKSLADQSTVSDANALSKATFEEMLAGVESAKNKAESIRDHATAIKDEVDSVKSELDSSVDAAVEKIEGIESFHQKIELVKRDLGKLQEDAAGAHDVQLNYNNRVKELVLEAESMVSGATTAGLAKAFDDERQKLSSEMAWAMLSFLTGIGFLFVTTILLAAYVFEIPIEVFGYNLGQQGATPERGDEITLAGVMSRTVILLAPFWLTLFSSRRYRNLFDLRQQYTHKYSMAFSVDGFKRQAPAYAEQIAAWVFHVVSEPPVTVKTSKSMGDNPLPDINSAIRSQLERFGLLAQNKQNEGEGG